MVFPSLGVSHHGFDLHPIDLNPNAVTDVEIKRTGHKLEIQANTLASSHSDLPASAASASIHSLF